MVKTKNIYLFLALLAVSTGDQIWGMKQNKLQEQSKYDDPEDKKFDQGLKESTKKLNPLKLPTLSIPNALRAVPSAILTAIMASFYTHATNEVPWCKEHWYLTFAGFGPGFVAAKWLGNKLGKDPKQTPHQVITPAFIGMLVGGYVGRTFGAPVAKLVCQKVGGWIGRENNLTNNYILVK